MPLKITDYVVVRGVTPGPKGIVVCPRGEPLRVLTLLNEAEFLKDHEPVHLRNVFFEDAMHDWSYANGKLRYYSRIGECNDIVLVYGEAEVPLVPKFCIHTGKPL